MTAAEAKAYNLFTVAPALEAVDDMVYKEEKILFPTALDLLTEQDWYEIYLQSDEYGYCLYAPAVRVDARRRRAHGDPASRRPRAAVSRCRPAASRWRNSSPRSARCPST